MKERKAYDGNGSASVQCSLYDYYGPTGHQGWGQFGGHAQVEETVYDGSERVARTITEFHQKIGDNQLDPRRGRPKKVTWQEWSGSSWVELRRVENTWGFAGLPERSVDVWQAMLVESHTFHNDSVRDRTLYLEDIYGNPRSQLSYGIHAGTVLTPTNSGFDVNDLNQQGTWQKYTTGGVPLDTIRHESGQVAISDGGYPSHVGLVWQ